MTKMSDLHDEIKAACSMIVGISDNGDGTYRLDYEDGTTEAQKQAARNAIANHVSLPEGAWDKLLDEFVTPGNALYEAVSKRAANSANNSNGMTYHYFQNLQQLISSSNPKVKKIAGLANAIKQLANEQARVLNPLTTNEKNQWNSLMDRLGFPASCKLN